MSPTPAPWFAGAALAIALCATFANSLAVPFFFDDPSAILDNPTIRDLGALGDVLSPPKIGSGVTGRPVVNLSLAINYAIGGLSPTGYHVANLCFHLVAALALFGCVRRCLLISPAAARFRRVALPAAFLTAALWMLHPLQTESVTCIIQRTELLVGMFYLLTFYFFLRAVEAPTRPWGGLAVASCFLGMASKEVMVTAPLLVLLFDRTFIAGSFAEAWRQRRNLYFGLAASWLLLAYLVLSVGGTRGEAAGFGVGVTWWSYALKQCEAILLYLKLTLWPNPLVVFYGIDVVTNPVAVLPQMLVLVVLVAGTFYALWRRPVLGFFGMWFFAILAPSSSVVPLVTQTVAEHRLYLPLAAPVVLAVTALFDATGRRAWIFGGIASLAFGVTSVVRNHDYRSDLAIWNDTVAKAPANARARVNLGAAFKALGNNEAALTQYQMALKIDPNSAEAFNNLATLLLDVGKPADAVGFCRTALKIKPKFAAAHSNLGTALAQIGQLDEAMTHMETALSLNPNLAEAHCNLTSALVTRGQLDRAIAHGETAVQLKPSLALAHLNLATAYIQKKQLERAKTELEAAIRVKPDYVEAYTNLGSVYYQAGDPTSAIPQYQAALRIQPNFLDARNNLASALFSTGHAVEAVEEYRAVLRINPGYVEAHVNLAAVLLRLGRFPESIAEFEEALRLNPNEARAKNGLAEARAAAANRR